MSVTLKNSQFAKDGIHVTYSDDSTQNLSFANNTLTVDSGLVVNVAKATLNQGLDVNGVKATLNQGLEVNNVLTKLNKGLEVAEKTNLKNDLDVLGKSEFKEQVKVTGADLIVTGKISASAALTATDGATVSGKALTATAGATVSGSALVATAGANVSGAALTATAGATVSGAMFTASNGATVSSGLTVSGKAMMNNNIEVSGASVLNAGLNVNNEITNLNKGVKVLNAMEVSGLSTFNNSLIVKEDAEIRGNMTIKGDLTITGSTIAINAQNLEIKDNVILMADGNTSDVVETGIMLQYQTSGDEAPKYAGIKRIPVTGELILFKDSNNKIGNNDVGSTEANNEVDAAKLALIAANSQVTLANNDVVAATTAVNAAVAVQTAAANAILPYAGSDLIAPIAGEFIIADFGANAAQLTGFNIGSFAGWTSLRQTTFLGSNDKVNFTFIQTFTFNQSTRSTSWTPVSYRYLKIIYESLESSYWGSNNNRFCPGNNGGTLAPLSSSALTLSSGLTGMYDQNGGSVSLSYFQVQFVAGAYSVSSGNYILSPALTSVALPDSDEYRQYVTDNASKNATLSTAVTAVATANSNKAAKVAILSTKQGLAGDASALVAAKQAIARSFEEEKYATVVADSFNSHSDFRLKKDIVELNGALEKLDSIRGVRYNWIAESTPENQVGVIAQEIQSVYPELVKEGGNGFLSVDYPKLTAVLIQALKELKALVLSK